MGYKILLVGAAILASAVIGDYCNVKDRFIEPVRYRNVKIDPKGYQKPFQLQKKYQVNEKGSLEVYIGNDGSWYKVDKNLRVNKKGLNELLKEEGRDIKSYFKEKINDLIDWYQGFKDENHN